MLKSLPLLHIPVVVNMLVELWVVTSQSSENEAASSSPSSDIADYESDALPQLLTLTEIFSTLSL